MMLKSPRGALMLALMAVPLATLGCGGNPNKDQPTQEASGEQFGGGPPMGPGRPGGPGGFGIPAQPGEVMPPAVQDQLKLTPEQKKQVQELQDEADKKLDKMLTEEQKKQLKEMRESSGPPGSRP